MECRIRITPFLKQCFAVSSVVLNLISSGFTVGFNASLYSELRKTQEIPLDIHSESWLASLVGITIFIGSIISSIVMETIGRKPAVLTCSVILICGWISLCLASSFPIVLLGKILHGMALGSITNVGNILIGEYSSPKYRGGFLATIPGALLFGTLTAHALAIFYNWHESPKILLSLSIPGLILASLSPESPSFLVKKGRYEDCKKAFHWLRGTEEQNEIDLMIKTDLIMKGIEKNPKLSILKSLKSKVIYFVKVFKKRECRIPIILMLHLNALNQLCGSVLNDVYALDIHTAIYGTDIYMYQVITSLDILRILGTASSIYIIHRLKRRFMLLICVCFNIFAYICVAGFIYARLNGYIVRFQVIIGICMHHLHFLCFSVGVVPLVFVISGEIYPLADRGFCTMISSTIFSVYMFVNIKSAPYIFSIVGVHGAFFLYSLIMVYCVAVAFVLLPETKDKTLHEIENEFRGRVIGDHEEVYELNGEDSKIVRN